MQRGSLHVYYRLKNWSK